MRKQKFSTRSRIITPNQWPWHNFILAYSITLHPSATLNLPVFWDNVQHHIEVFCKVSSRICITRALNKKHRYASRRIWELALTLERTHKHETT